MDRKALGGVWLYLVIRGTKVGSFTWVFNIQRESKILERSGIFQEGPMTLSYMEAFTLTHYSFPSSSMTVLQTYKPVFWDNKHVQYSKMPELIKI